MSLINNSFKPELLAPAGNLEKLKVALSYGADAVYVGGQKFGLRAASDNFTNGELKQGIEFAKKMNKSVFIVLNGFLHDQDLKELPEYIEFLSSVGINAAIVSDLGVLKTVKRYSDIPVHVSTQASTLNRESAKFWRDMGASRVILGRETSVKDGYEIKKASGLEVEMFIHGSMCMAYSGNCVISNYTAGRDSNRGGCAHSCRFEYSFTDSSNANLDYENAFFMSSKDLNGLSLLPEFCDFQIDSLKVEGRMKGPLYAGSISKAYREGIDAFYDGKFNNQKIEELQNQLKRFSHRDYTEASLSKDATEDSVFNKREETKSEYTVAGYVKDYISESEEIVLEVKRSFSPSSDLELVPFKGENISFTPKHIHSVFNEKIEKTKPSSLVKLPYRGLVEPGCIIRQKENKRT